MLLTCATVLVQSEDAELQRDDGPELAGLPDSPASRVAKALFPAHGDHLTPQSGAFNETPARSGSELMRVDEVSKPEQQQGDYGHSNSRCVLVDVARNSEQCQGESKQLSALISSCDIALIKVTSMTDRLAIRINSACIGVCHFPIPHRIDFDKSNLDFDLHWDDK